MKTYLLIMTGILAASCSLSEINPSQRPSRNDIWQNPSFGKDSSNVDKTTCYMTAFDYPEGYEWKADTDNGNVKCSLIVFANDVPVMKIPVGKEYEVSSDPDMHRILGGHLYTDYSTDHETVIKKDGQELFRYDGREMILDMIIYGTDIFTLGCPRRGDGLILRKNGIAEFQKESASPIGKIQIVEDGISFAYREMIPAADRTLERYWIFQAGQARQVAVRDDIRKVWDIIQHEGDVCYLAGMTGIDQPVLVKGEKLSALDTPSGTDIITGRMFSAGGTIATELIYTDSHVYYSCGIWIESKQHRLFNTGVIISGICTWDKGVYCILNSGDGNGGGTIFRCGETMNAPEGYTMMGNNPICVTDGILRIGLSSLTGGKPIIWKDGVISEIDINGYICTLTSD